MVHTQYTYCFLILLVLFKYGNRALIGFTVTNIMPQAASHVWESAKTCSLGKSVGSLWLFPLTLKFVFCFKQSFAYYGCGTLVSVHYT